MLERHQAKALLRTTLGFGQSQLMLLVTTTEASVHDGAPCVDASLELREVVAQGVAALGCIALELLAFALQIYGFLKLSVLLSGAISRRCLGRSRFRGFASKHQHYGQQEHSHQSRPQYCVSALRGTSPW